MGTVIGTGVPYLVTIVAGLVRTSEAGPPYPPGIVTPNTFILAPVVVIAGLEPILYVVGLQPE